MKFKNIQEESFEKFPTVLTPELVVGNIPKFKEPKIIRNWLLWLEQRSTEDGRSTILIRPWGCKNYLPQELTPFPINVKSRLHGYGGAPFSIAYAGNQLFLTWINDIDGCLWLQKWSGLNFALIDEHPQLKKDGNALCLSKAGEYNLADGLIDLTRERWLGVMEERNKDYLVSFELKEELQKPKILYEPKDFIGYLAINKTSQKLVWVEWNQPYMPWDSSYLKVGYFNKKGDIKQKEILDINLSMHKNLNSIFQPIWLNNQEILVVSDINGWWNLVKVNIEHSYKGNLKFSITFSVESELGLPQWVSGMSTLYVIEDQIFYLACEQATWKLYILQSDGISKHIDIPFDNLSDLKGYKNKIVAIASNSYCEPGLLEIDIKNSTYSYQSPRKISFQKNKLSTGEPFYFKGYNGQITHSWCYRPLKVNHKYRPLLVKAHSGPTSMADNGLDLETQFWTSRGWTVLNVNYGGSTGFGRKYRDRLKSHWGEVDSFDCCAAVNCLINMDIVDKDLIAIIGSSAGGFTALSCLISSDIFSVAACKYPVVDLLDMHSKTHRFEQGYLDYLIGPYDNNHQLYKDRSPINNVSKINCPVILFQGLKDKIVSPNETKKLFYLLKNRNIPVEMHCFDNEGHGFNNFSTKVKVLSETEIFFRKNLSL